MDKRESEDDGKAAEGEQGTPVLKRKRDKKAFAREKDHSSVCPPIADPHWKEVSYEVTAGHLPEHFGPQAELSGPLP